MSERGSMPLAECYDHLAGLRRDEVVVTSAGTASGEWYARSSDLDASFYLQASMGMASTFALGFALAVPEAQVWVFNGDGSLVMNPGALLTEAEAAPPNLVHFVLANRAYGATGGLPYVNATGVDFLALAGACGIDRAFAFDDVAEFRAGIGKVLAEQRYSYVVLELTAEQGMRSEIPIDGVEQKYRFARHVERAFGRTVFNKWGY